MSEDFFLTTHRLVNFIMPILGIDRDTSLILGYADHYQGLSKVHLEMDDINYKKRCKEENDRIYTWLLVGKQLGICKDVRTLIAEEIWQQFFEDD